MVVISPVRGCSRPVGSVRKGICSVTVIAYLLSAS
jgi:hypothetical protein